MADVTKMLFGSTIAVMSIERLWCFCAGLWHATTLAMAQDLAPRFTVTPDMAEAIQRPDLPPLADAYTESASWQ